MKPTETQQMSAGLRRVIITCLLIGISTLLQGQERERQNFISYEFSGGRFGDNLLAYLHAKWLSYKYCVPLLYKPFPYSSGLALHDAELPYSQINPHLFQKTPLMKAPEILPFSDNFPKIYVCPYFPECQWEREHTQGPSGKRWDYFSVDWTDPPFHQLLQKLVAPKQLNHPFTPPKETINIAIHIREGGTYDKGNFAFHFITKFPPLDFYIEGLQEVIALFPNRPLYCYVFTDAIDPTALVKKIQQSVPPQVPITFDCRSKNNFHNQNVLEDFFSLFQFDVLIHSQSNFSLIPPLIHDYAVVYAPLSGRRTETATRIDRVKFEVNETLYQELLLK